MLIAAFMLPPITLFAVRFLSTPAQSHDPGHDQGQLMETPGSNQELATGEEYGRLVLGVEGRWKCSCIETTIGFSVRTQLLQIVTWMEIAMLFGPFAPILFPIVAMAILSNYIAYVLTTKHLEIAVDDDMSEMSVAYLIFACVTCVSFACHFAWASPMLGKWILTLAFPSCFMAPVVVQRLCCRASSSSLLSSLGTQSEISFDDVS
jgi:hypothetical protein